jgi:hypothetical protein
MVGGRVYVYDMRATGEVLGMRAKR